MGFRGSLACQGRMESRVSLAFLARGARWVGRASLETLGKEDPLDLMATLEKLACRGHRECSGSLVTQDHWGQLATQDRKA